MKSKTLLGLLIVAVLVTLAGCASNPKGNMGPSWDVPIRVPMAQDESKTVEEFLEDAPEEVEIPSEAGKLVGIEDEIKDDKVENFKVGDDLLAEVESNLPGANDYSIGLDPITVEGIAGDIEETVTVSGGLTDGTLEGIDLGFGDSSFESVTFSGDTANELEVTVTNKAADVTVEELELTLNNPEGNEQTITLKEIATDETESGTWDLADETLPNGDETDNYAVVDIKATTSGSGSGELDLTFGFPEQVEVSKVTNLEGPDINEQVDFEPLSYDDFESGLQQVAFSSGSLGVDIDPDNQFSDIDFDVTDLQMANLSSDTGSIDLTDNQLDLTEELEIDFGLEVTSTSDTLTYDSEKDVVVEGGFTGPVIKEVALDAGQFRDITNQDIGLKSGEEYDLSATLLEGLDIPEEADDIKLNDSSLKLNLEGLEAFDIDLTSVVFKALDSNGDELKSYQPGLNIDGQKEEFNLMDDDSNGVNFLDLLQTPDTQDIIVEGGFDAEDINATTGTTTVDKETTVGMESVTADIPLDFEVAEPISEVMVASVDSLDQDEVDDIKDGVKRFEIMMEEITNQFGIKLEAQVYLAELDQDYGDPDDLPDDELDELEDTVAQEEHILAVSDEENQGFTIDATTDDNTIDKQLMVDPDEADRLRGDNLYFGIKVTIPQTDSVNFKTGDTVSIADAFAVLTAKVNQDND